LQETQFLPLFRTVTPRLQSPDWASEKPERKLRLRMLKQLQKRNGSKDRLRRMQSPCYRLHATPPPPNSKIPLASNDHEAAQRNRLWKTQRKG
jgi:hypothetical protein